MKNGSYGRSKGFSRSKSYSKYGNMSMYVLLGVLVLSSIAFVFMSQRYNMSFEPFENAKTKRIEYYYKEECPHCVNFKPTWDKVSTDSELLKMVDFVSYDIKNDGGKSAKYGINSIPEVIAVDINSGDKKAVFQSDTRSVSDLTGFVKANK
jgi:thiol-disulfide isomerase/thioredoxin